MKRFLTFFAAAVFCSLMICCGNNNISNDDKEDNATESPIVGEWNIDELILDDVNADVTGTMTFKSDGTFIIEQTTPKYYYCEATWHVDDDYLYTETKDGIIEKLRIENPDNENLIIKGELEDYSYTYHLKRI